MCFLYAPSNIQLINNKSFEGYIKWEILKRILLRRNHKGNKGIGDKGQKFAIEGIGLEVLTYISSFHQYNRTYIFLSFEHNGLYIFCARKIKICKSISLMKGRIK